MTLGKRGGTHNFVARAVVEKLYYELTWVQQHGHSGEPKLDVSKRIFWMLKFESNSLHRMETKWKSKNWDSYYTVSLRYNQFNNSENAFYKLLFGNSIKVEGVVLNVLYSK
jgi:hypothetical protein